MERKTRSSYPCTGSKCKDVLLDGKRVDAVEYRSTVEAQPLKIQKCRDGVMLYLSEVPTDIDKVIELHLEE